MELVTKFSKTVEKTRRFESLFSRMGDKKLFRMFLF
jgi:hypothetical protein